MARRIGQVQKDAPDRFPSRFLYRRPALLFGSVVLLLIGFGLGLNRGLPAPVDSKPAASLSPARPVSPLFSPDHAAELLEGPKRDNWQRPLALVNALHLKEGEIVADIGAGSGYLMPFLSRSVGASGCAFEEEIQDAFLPVLTQKARSFANVRVVRGRADDPRLPPGSVDCFVLLTVYHEVENPVAFLRALRETGRLNARLAIIDFDASIKGDPPAPEGHWIAAKTVIEEARDAGWELAEQHAFLRPASQFFLVFRPRKIISPR